MPVFFAVEDIQPSQGVIMGYLIEMGLDPGVMVYGLTMPPNDIYVLVESGFLNSRLPDAVMPTAEMSFRHHGSPSGPL